MRRFFRSIVTLISLVASGFLMLSVLTAYVNPSRIWLLAFLGFGFPILWGINVLLVLLWASKRRWQLLIPLVAIVLTWGHWNNTFQWKGKQLKEAQKLEMPLSVMSFNLRMWDFYSWTKGNL